MAIIFTQNLGRYNEVLSSRGQPIIVSNFAEGDYQLHTDWRGLQPVDFDDIWNVDRNSTATYFDANGVLQTAAVNQPRIDYSTGEGRLLVEPQRTRLNLYPTQFDNAYWMAARLTKSTANTPLFGDITSTKLVETVEGGTKLMYSNVSLNNPANVNVTVSFIVKAAERTKVSINFNSRNSVNSGAKFDLLTGAYLGAYLNTPIKYSSKPLSDGWFLLSVTALNGNNPLNGSFPARIYLLNDLGEAEYAGDGSSGVYVAASQMEQGDKPTSLILGNEASQVTRLADIITPKGDA